MKQREYIFNLTKDGKSPGEIQNFLHEQFGKQALSRTTVYKWAGQAKLGFSITNEREHPGPKPDEILCLRIQQILEEKPYSSLRSIGDELNETNVTIYRYMTKYLHKVFKASKWVPHSLNLDQKKKRVEQSKALAEILIASKHESFRNVITGDQKWFNFYNGSSGAWLDIDQKPPQMVDDHISSKKVMVTIIWGVYGFFIVNFLPEGESYDSEYFISNILEPLSNERQNIWAGSKRKKIWLHLDNSKVHNSILTSQKYNVLGFKRTPQPPYSPDIAPSDFYLFGFLEEKLKGRVFEDMDELFEAIVEILNSISKETLKKVFNHWIERCQWVAHHNGEYFTK